MSDTAKYILPLFFTLAATSLPGLAQGAGAGGTGFTIKCWKNDLGIRECGNSVPPEYSQKRIEVLNSRGMVVKVIQPPKTHEQLEKEREQARQRKAEEAVKKEQQKQDNILLNSYANVRDLKMARDTNVKAVQADLDIAQGNLKMLQKQLVDQQTKAGNYERSGKKPPKRLVDRIDNTKELIADKQQSIDKRKQKLAAMKQHFAKDLARFRKLKGLDKTN